MAVLAAAHSGAVAGHPLVTDDDGTVPGGEAEVEVSGALLSEAAIAGGELSIGVGVRTGLADSLDAGLAVAYTLVDVGEQWRADVDVPAVDVKWHLWSQRGARPGLALRVDYQPAQGIDARISGHHAGALAVMSWQRGRAGVHLNVGTYRHDEPADAEKWACISSVAATVQASSVVVIAGELVADGVPDPHAASSLAGIGWELAPRRVASAGVGVAWKSDQPVAWIATFGLTASFGGRSP